MIRPATDGTNEMLEGVALRDVSHSELEVLSLKLSSGKGVRGSSFEYTTFRCFTPLRFSSYRIALANGHTDVLYMSVTSNAVGSSLFPVPIEDIIGTPAFSQLTARAIFPDTVSMASTT